MEESKCLTCNEIYKPTTMCCNCYTKYVENVKNHEKQATETENKLKRKIEDLESSNKKAKVTEENQIEDLKEPEEESEEETKEELRSQIEELEDKEGELKSEIEELEEKVEELEDTEGVLRGEIEELEEKVEELEELEEKVEELEYTEGELRGEIEELEDKIEDLESSNKKARSTEENLRSQIEDLKSTLNFMLCSAVSPPPFSDVILVASDDTSPVPISANRAILVFRSPVFRAMLEKEMEETKSGVIKIGEVSNEALGMFVSFMYTAEAVLDEKMACDLLMLGDKYQISHLKTYCERFLKSGLNWENSLPIYAFARQNNSKILMDASSALLVNDIQNLSKRQDFGQFMENDPSMMAELYEAHLMADE